MKKTVAIIGSSGAIGNAVAEILLDDDGVEAIYRFSRNDSNENSDRVKNLFLDIEDEESIKDCIKNPVSYTHLTLPTR